MHSRGYAVEIREITPNGTRMTLQNLPQPDFSLGSVLESNAALRAFTA